ncbi:helix-turn-helix transcriptional regulator [Actinophytocola sediminis]
MKKRLGAFLRDVRKGAGKTMDEAADLLKAKRPTVSRYETGEVLPIWSTVHMLLTFYNAPDGDVIEAARLFDDAKDEPRSVRLPAGAPKAYRKLVNAEREAVRERELAPYVVPGLLQTKRYASALEQAAHLFYEPNMRSDSVVAARMNRQKPLDGPNPMQLHALIDEAVLHRQIGGPDVLREQVEHLLFLAERDNIALQVLPYTTGGYSTMNGSFIIVDYPEPDTIPGVYLEYPAGGAWVDNEKDVQRFTTTFDQATDLALSPTKTTHLLQQLRARDPHDDPHDPLAQKQRFRRRE